MGSRHSCVVAESGLEVGCAAVADEQIPAHVTEELQRAHEALLDAATKVSSARVLDAGAEPSAEQISARVELERAAAWYYEALGAIVFTRSSRVEWLLRINSQDR